ncbi:MAG TPA: NAD(P)-dependent oxidoreductase [bacterium]|nr:NAD(P)-dependent oxidoreductase [bacterium]
MKIALIGATGMVGSAVLEELLGRGHQVTAIARDVSKLKPRPNLVPQKGDVYNVKGISQLMTGHDAVFCATNPGAENPDVYQLTIKGVRSLIEGVKASGVKRLFLMGGAGSLKVAPGLQLVDTPGFPAGWKQAALGLCEALNILRQEKDLEWTFISPGAFLQPGERTGKFRLGGDQLLTDAKGESRISTGDLAVAIVDELEKPKHIRRRFTAAY